MGHHSFQIVGLFIQNKIKLKFSKDLLQGFKKKTFNYKKTFLRIEKNFFTSFKVYRFMIFDSNQMPQFDDKKTLY